MLTSNNRMNDFELDNVVGGTRAEVDQIVWAYCNTNLRNDYFFAPGGYATKSGKYLAEVPILENFLKSDFNIDANISVGFYGSGMREKANTYSINGKSISHQEVISMINARR